MRIGRANDAEPVDVVECADEATTEGVAQAKLSRRSVLTAGVGLAAAACGPAPQPEAELDPAVQAIRSNQRDLGRVPETPATAEELAATMRGMVIPSYFPQPGEMRINETDRGDKHFTLEVDYLDLDFVRRSGAIVRGRVRAYNRHVPGPTIRCDPGDRLNITLRNNLPEESFPYDYQGCEVGQGSQVLGPAAAGLPHAFNTTNLHTHGLHVSPASLCGDVVCDVAHAGQPTLASDDVLIEVAPGTQQEYCIVLPDFHAPGTHWYHAHKHGSTAVQVNNGLVGALIVQEHGDYRILGDEPHEDQIFLMQEIMEVDGANDQLVYAQTQGESSKFFVNGVYQPRMRMQTGEIQRWRFINATSRPRGLAKLRLVRLGDEPLRDTSDIELSPIRGRGLEQGIEPALQEAQSLQPELYDRVSAFQRIAAENAQPMHLIAIDGISLYGQPPREVLEWDFAPGNRADFLVRIDDPGTYAIVKDLHPWAGTSPEVQQLAFVEVLTPFGPLREPRSLPTVIPGERPCYLSPIESVESQKTIDFNAVNPGSWDATCQGVDAPWMCTGSQISCGGTVRDCNPAGLPALLPRIFAVDCARFDPDEVEAKYTMQLNTAEEWTLRNLGGGAHPFHIHVNPFQVVEIFDPDPTTGGTTTFTPEEAAWQDVVAIPLPKNNIPGYVKIRHRFLTYPGDFVIHCHFLNHEDLGMMKRVRVVATIDSQGHGPCEPVSACSLGSG